MTKEWEDMTEKEQEKAWAEYKTMHRPFMDTTTRARVDFLDSATKNSTNFSSKRRGLELALVLFLVCLVGWVVVTIL